MFLIELNASKMAIFVHTKQVVGLKWMVYVTCLTL